MNADNALHKPQQTSFAEMSTAFCKEDLNV